MTRFRRFTSDAQPAPSKTVNPSVFVALAGLWLLGAPVVADYGDAAGFAGRYNDRVVGGLLLAIALVRIVARTSTGWLSLVNVTAGAWLIAAPFVLRYGRDAAGATWNDVIIGAVVVLLAGVSWFVARADLQPPR